MIHIDLEILLRQESTRGLLLSRATQALLSTAKHIDALSWEEPAAAASDLRGAVNEGSVALLLVAEVAGYFDAVATMQESAMENGAG